MQYSSHGLVMHMKSRFEMKRKNHYSIVRFCRCAYLKWLPFFSLRHDSHRGWDSVLLPSPKELTPFPSRKKKENFLELHQFQNYCGKVKVFKVE